MKTGIFIRAKVNGKWDSVDIGDVRLPDAEVATWLSSSGGENVMAEKVAMILLGRDPLVVRDNQ